MTNLNENFIQKKHDLVQQLGQDTIFEALLKLMQEEGLDGITMQKVAHGAGMAIGSLYKYFDSKEALINYADSRMFELFLNETAKIPDEMPADQKLLEFTKISLSFFKNNSGTYTILEQARLSKMINRSQHQKQKGTCFLAIKHIFDEGMAAGLFRQHDSDTAVMLYLSLLVGFYHTHIDKGEEITEAKISAIHDMIMRYLKE